MSLVLSASTPRLRTSEANLAYTNDLTDVLASLIGDDDPGLVSVQAVTFEQSTIQQFSWAVTLEQTPWTDARAMIRAWGLTQPIANGYAAVTVVLGTATAVLGTWYR